jgi:hypothetical protein
LTRTSQKLIHMKMEVPQYNLPLLQSASLG